MAFVRVSGYSQTDVDNARTAGYNSGYTAGHTAGYNEGYTAGYADGQDHPNITSQSQSAYFPAGSFSDITLTYSFAHGVAGLTGWHAWLSITSMSISGNTVTISGRLQSTSPATLDVTAKGY